MKPQHKRKNAKQQFEKQHETAPLSSKVSYRWVEALTTVEQLVSKHTRVIHVFDKEGDITEVFDKVRQLQHTGVLVRRYEP